MRREVTRTLGASGSLESNGLLRLAAGEVLGVLLERLAVVRREVAADFLLGFGAFRRRQVAPAGAGDGVAVVGIAGGGLPLDRAVLSGT
jgi:hypothetical protein